MLIKLRGPGKSLRDSGQKQSKYGRDNPDDMIAPGL